MRETVPPAHFGYMASGIDDEVTLTGESRGLSEVPVQAPPAGRREQGRHEHGDSRREVQHADRLAPVGTQKAFHADGRSPWPGRREPATT